MLTNISHNPFRILDVYADASQRQILANKGKRLALASVGKSTERLLDMPGFLPNINCDATAIEEAYKQLHLPTNKVKHVLMWMMRPDEESLCNALQNCKSDNIEQTISSFADYRLTIEGDQNAPLWLLHDLMFLNMLAGKYSDAYFYVSELSQRVDEWLRCTGCEIVGLRPSDLTQMFIDVAEQNGISIDIEERLIDIHRRLLELTEKVEKNPAFIFTLYKESLASLPLLKMAPGYLDSYYLDIANKIAKAIIDVCLYYTSDNNEYRFFSISKSKASELADYAESVMYGTSLAYDLQHLRDCINSDADGPYINPPSTEYSKIDRGCSIATIAFYILIAIILCILRFTCSSSESTRKHSYQTHIYSGYKTEDGKLPPLTEEQMEKLREMLHESMAKDVDASPSPTEHHSHHSHRNR